MSDLPEHLEKHEQEEVGAAHGDVTGAWRVVRNGMVLAVLALGLVYLFFL
jgi:hypothetical protein